LIIRASHWDASHAVAHEATAAEGHIIDASDARAVIANSFPRLRAYIGIYVRCILRLSCLAEIHRALGAVIVRVARLGDHNEVAVPIAPHVFAIPSDLRSQLAEWFELQAAEAIFACRCPAARIPGLRTIGCHLAFATLTAPSGPAAATGAVPSQYAFRLGQTHPEAIDLAFIGARANTIPADSSGAQTAVRRVVARVD
jgi:hypothetical protein